jgi:hypothetical protein
VTRDAKDQLILYAKLLGKNNNGCSTPRETRRRGFLGWDNLRKGKKEKGKRKIGKRRS